jgi:hypothetical protein
VGGIFRPDLADRCSLESFFGGNPYWLGDQAPAPDRREKITKSLLHLFTVFADQRGFFCFRVPDRPEIPLPPNENVRKNKQKEYLFRQLWSRTKLTFERRESCRSVESGPKNPGGRRSLGYALHRPLGDGPAVNCLVPFFLFR